MFSNLVIIPFYLYYLIRDDFINIDLSYKLFRSLFFSILVISILYAPIKNLLYIEKNILGLIFNILLIGSLILLIKIVDLLVVKNQINVKELLSIKNINN